MGGEITLKSRVGRGSTFRLALPATRADAPIACEDGARAPALLDGVRVLVADDNPINRELARAILEHAGVDVSEAGDGAEAVEAARRLPVDLILMDVRMPRLDGVQAAWTIRRTPGPNQDIPILAFSADSELRREGPAGPFTGRVGKPVSSAALLAALAAAIGAEFQSEQEEVRRGVG
jgi:CheY-like chemotaxis protein